MVNKKQIFTNNIISRCTHISVDFKTFTVKLLYTYRELNLFTFRAIFPQIASIFTYSIDIFTYRYLFHK